MDKIDKYFNELREKIGNAQAHIEVEEVGEIEEVRDEVAFLSGLNDVFFGEKIEFKNNIFGLVIDLAQERVGVIVFGDYQDLLEGEKGKRTNQVFSIPVSENLLGRVINPLGEPIDGLGRIESEEYRPIEKIAPSVIYRKPVDTPLHTGIKALDTLIPIGRGQRELIIGDRQTGKSTIAVDTILNQKGENVICIYNFIGQKQSKIAQTVDLLRRKGAMEYTIVVSASSSDPTSLQYISPYAACSLGEYFMEKGRDVLVVYDDLTRHAWAYRQISLVLRRPAGREAYPGDIFYLHSRLLERACRLNEKYGGGSLTALPIVETQEGDISGYIPTNIISITDGQIFLETDLFNAGIRPAINIGISVSRVGSSAQTKAMKKVAGRLKLDLAQYRELAALAQFESELDEKTKKFLDRGARMTEILKQGRNQPLDLAHQVVIIWAGVNGYLDNLPLSEVSQFEKRFFSYISQKGRKILETINQKRDIDQETEQEMKRLTEEFIRLNYSNDTNQK
ncbi:MAG: F0F1 ATP synthase subunit alpha [Nitrososphaeria archaeon]